MKPHLLHLPGELRNKIFEYAFTIDDGICYRKDRFGVGWLCLHPQQSERGPEDESRARERHKTTETGQTIDKPVVAAEEMKRPAQVTVNGHVVANQLQFVNHQLRNETRALAIRYNDIHILDAPEHLAEFVYSVVGHKRLWIQKIIRRVEVPMGSPYDLNLDEEMHPGFMVHIHTPLARLEDDVFFMTALQVQHSGRRNRSFVARLTQNLDIQQVLQNVPISFREIPSYVKVFPWDREFDEAAIRRYCKVDGPEQRFLVRTSPGGIDGMVALAKEWFESGF